MCDVNGRVPIKEKIDYIKTWPTPKNLKQLRGFLGMCGFYRLWIEDYSTVAEPLFRLTKKNQDFYIGSEQLEAIEKLKAMLSSPPILKAPDYSEGAGKLILTVDASPVGAGAVLGQENPDGTRNACRYESYTFSERERRYPQVKRELLALKIMVKKLKEYLYGIKFTLETDAKPLLAMINKVDLPNDAAGRWISYLHMFDFELKHIKGDNNTVADALSRIPQEVNVENFNSKVQEIENNRVDLHGSDNDNVDEIDFELNCGDKDEENSDKDLVLREIKKYLQGFYLENSPKLRKRIKNLSTKFFIHNGYLYKRGGKNSVPKRVIENFKDREEILKKLHKGGGGGHRGRDGTYIK
ncbi:Retrovirus-related Pol polyprotein from transposon, partial [Smittium culicis]